MSEQKKPIDIEPAVTPKGISPRKARARHLAACCMNAIDQCVAPALQDAAFQTLEAMFENQDAEVITADHRKAAGLPPRNELGMTDAEMAAIDAAKARLISRPLVAKATTLGGEQHQIVGPAIIRHNGT